MATITTEVEVDIDLDEFDTEDILEELESRIRHKKISEHDLKRINNLSTIGVTVPKTLVGVMKLEAFLKNIDKFTLEDLEE